MHWQHYKRFALEGQDILGDINRYVAHKQYNTDTGDLITAMLCNAFSVRALIYTYHNNDVLEVEQKPQQDDAITTIRLSLAGEHYDAVICTSQHAHAESKSATTLEPTTPGSAYKTVMIKSA